MHKKILLFQTMNYIFKINFLDNIEKLLIYLILKYKKEIHDNPFP